MFFKINTFLLILSNAVRVLDSVQCSASAVGRRGAVSDGSAAVGSVSSSLALGT